MNKHYSHYWLVALICLAMSSFGGFSSYAQHTGTEEDVIPEQETELDKLFISAQETETKGENAVQVESETLIEFEREVHFLTPQGENAVVSSGMYRVESADGGLRLTPSVGGDDKAVTIQAEATTHEESVESSRLISTAGEGDQHVVMLLLPDGQALQATGSYSGVSGRGAKKKKGGFKFGGRKIILKPRLTSILAVPPTKPRRLVPPGHVTPFGTLYLKGHNFGTAKGTVTLQVQTPVPQNFWLPKGTLTLPGTTAGTKRIQLKVQSWKADRISVFIQPMKGVPDHSAVVQVLTDARKRSNGRAVPFYALRGGKPSTLKLGEAVTSYRCSDDSDRRGCMTNVYTKINEQSCFTGGSTASLRKDKTISVFHANCDIVGSDSGTDQFTIKLKKGWVIKALRRDVRRSSTNEYVGLLKNDALTEKYEGHSSVTLKVPWKVSPGYDSLSYWIDIDVVGPMGVPY